jgi:hypothetical protein
MCIEDEHYVDRSRSHQDSKHFTRKRKLPLKYLIIFITQSLTRSIQRELNSFYQQVTTADFSIQQVTKGAFTQARAKLKPEAFVELNRVGIASFYQDAPYKKWQGLRLLSVDGSTLVLPKHKSVAQQFGTTGFGPDADSKKSVARISMLYDVLNFTTLDAQIDRYDSDERALLRRHLACIKPGEDLVLLDRGYPSLALMFELHHLGIHYCMRMGDHWWLEVRKMLKEGQKDKIVTFALPDTNKELLTKYNTTDKQFKCRLVVVDLPEAGQQVLCTSVLQRRILPYDSFASLYHYRWNIEEGYKLYKSRIQLEVFSGKTALAVKQDFFARVFMMTTMAVLAFPVEEKIRQEQQDSTRKHQHKINRTNALSMVKEIIVKVFIHKMIEPAMKAFDSIVSATTEIVRPNRKFNRHKLKKKPPAMNYKQL